MYQHGDASPALATPWKPLPLAAELYRRPGGSGFIPSSPEELPEPNGAGSLKENSHPAFSPQRPKALHSTLQWTLESGQIAPLVGRDGEKPPRPALPPSQTALVLITTSALPSRTGRLPPLPSPALLRLRGQGLPLRGKAPTPLRSLRRADRKNQGRGLPSSG